MLKSLITKIFRRKLAPGSFYSLNSAERKKIIKEAARTANEEQIRFINECRGEFGSSYVDSCKSTSLVKN